MAESSLLAGFSFGWPPWLNQSGFDQSGGRSDYPEFWIPLPLLNWLQCPQPPQSARSRRRRGVQGRRFVKDNIAAYPHLLRPGVVVLVPLLLVRVANQDTFLGLGIQLPSSLIRHVHVCNIAEYPEMRQIWLSPKM